MKVTGIIAECNPLHEGHRYLIREARSLTCADYIVVALSGDYVQRGAPAVLSREARTRDLLRAGADLVIEIPLYAACSGADYFARGAVALMESLGVVTDLAFGSESGDLSALTESAGILAGEPEEFRKGLQQGLREGLSYPRARAEAMHDIDLPSSPNDLLGTEYLQALLQSGSTIRAHAVKRTVCRSASDIRAQMIDTRQNTDPFLCRDDFSDLLLHALYIAGSADELSGFLDVSPDLAQRIANELPRFRSYSQFCSHVKTRNYTYTRISRALLHILLGMKSRTMERFDAEHGLCGWIRPIGFRRSAAPLIRSITSSCTVPYLDKLSRARKILAPDLNAVLDDELRAEFLYDLMAARRTAAAGTDEIRAVRSTDPSGGAHDMNDSSYSVPYGLGKPLITLTREQD